MYFQVENTPEIVRKKKIVLEAQEVENPRLVLKPFSAPPVVTFENVCINSKTERILEVFNPSAIPLQLSFAKTPPAELGLNLSWEEICVEPDSVALLHLTWCPQTPAAQRFSIQITDQKRGRYDIVIICKTFVSKKLIQAKAKRKLPLASNIKTTTTVTSKTSVFTSKTSVFTSVTSKKSPKASNFKRHSPKMYTPRVGEINNLRSFLNVDNLCVQDSSMKYKGSPAKNVIPPYINNKLPDPWTSKTDHFKGRETYLVQDYDKENECSYSLQPQTFKMNRKGNCESFSPTSIFNSIENMEFTPSRVSRQYYSKEAPIIVDKENMYHLTPEYVTKANKENNRKNSFGNNMDSLIDNLAFTPVLNRNVNRSTGARNVKSPKAVTLEIFDSPDKENIIVQHSDYRNNHMMKETIDMHTYHTQYNARQLQYHQQQVPHPNTVSANLTHPIIDLCDLSNFSKMDDPKDATYYSAKPNILISGAEEEEGFPVSSHYCNVNALTPNALDYSHFTPNKNLSDINDSLQNFNPNRCSTETKDFDHSSCRGNSRVCKDLFVGYSPSDGMNVTFGKLSSDTFVKGDSPIVPAVPNNQSSPYSVAGSPPVTYAEPQLLTYIRVSPRQLPFNENLKSFNERVEMRNAIKQKNNISGVRDILEANLWQKTPPKPASPSPLAPIPEECTFFSEVSAAETYGHPQCETFIVDKTFEISKPTKCANTHKPIPHDNTRWMKTLMKGEARCTTSVVRNFTKEETVERSTTLGQTTEVSDETYNYVSIKSIATTVDPFLAATFLYDERAYSELEEEFKMWLNYLLTPPADLETNLDSTKIDIGKAWIESRNKAAPAPTKEQVSAKYHTSHRLESLRKSAKTFIDNADMSQVFLKVANQVEKKFLSIRTDKNIHLDIGLQKIILNLLMCYNPLWLRIGLETLYGTKIPLSSNDDFMGLSAFIIERLFRDPYSSTGTKHSLPNVHSPQYTENVKKFTLKKFLFLVYFLDQAKLNKMIPHDPCLFCRNAPFKESRQILIQFTKEVLSGVGDINKHLRPTGYLVSHKQTYLHEFKYAVHNLAVDLKDGVRLTRLMEIILMKENLTAGLRTPPISLLQKLHNVKLALSALEAAGFQIVGDITPKDIVDGHREKTLSLLWQLINQFRAPLFCTSALVIQKWWRKKYIAVWINKRIEHKKKLRLFNAATKIQSWWKAIITRNQYLVTLQQKTQASIVLQKYWRMWTCRNYYKNCKKSSIIIQSWFRRIIATRNARKVLIEKRKCSAAVVIQRRYRKMKLLQQLRANNEDRGKFLQLRESATRLQTAFRAYKSMKETRRVYVTLKESTIKIQRYYRALVVRRSIQKQYLELKSSTLIIQRRFRANLLMHTCQKQYTDTKNAVVTIQQSYRNWMLAKQVRNNYLHLRAAAVLVQQKFRALLAMRAARVKFLKQKQSAIVLQTYIRAYLEMRMERNRYQVTRLACTIIQQHYRAHSSMKAERYKYLQLKQACRVLQSHYRARLSMLRVKQDYCKLQKATLIIQTRFRSLMLMRAYRSEYLKKYQAVMCIQTMFRGRLETIRCQKEFSAKREMATRIQQWYRSVIYTRKIRLEYVSLRLSALNMQRRYRSNMLSKECRGEFLALKSAADIIQTRFRAYLQMKAARKTYLVQIKAIVTIQKYYKGHLSTKKEKQRFLQLKSASVNIQRRFRANREMIEQRKNFGRIRQAAIVFQQRFRALIIMRIVRTEYLKKNKAILVIQRYFRANTQMKKEKTSYNLLRQASIVLQQRYRAIIIMRKIKAEYVRQYNAILVIQRYYRAKKDMEYCQREYNIQRSTTIRIQQWYRSILSMRSTRSDYVTLRTSTIIIQRRYRQILLTRSCRRSYLELRKACTVIQTRYRAKISMQHCQKEYISQRIALIRIQQWYRSIISMRLARLHYETLRASTVLLQQRYRELVCARSCRHSYLELRKACTVIQTRYRAKISMKHYQNEYNSKRIAVIRIQQWYRSIISMRLARLHYETLRASTVLLQKRYRELVCARSCRHSYLELRKACTVIQTRYRAKISMKHYQNEYNSKRIAVIRIQLWYRSIISMRLARLHYETLRASTVLLQQRYRELVCARSCRHSYLELRRACTIIQMRYRAKISMQHCQNEYNSKRIAVITIQQWYRSIISMRLARLHYETIRASTVLLQQRYRELVCARSCRHSYLELRRACTIIQMRYHAKISMRHCQNEYISQRIAVIRIQQWYRSILSMRLVRLSYVKHRSSIITIQQRYRQILQTRTCRNSYLELRKACTVIQTRYRAKISMQICQKDYISQRIAIIRIQQWYRSIISMRLARLSYETLRASTVLLQQRYRELVLAKSCRHSYLELRRACTIIQSRYRAKISMKQCLNEYSDKRQAVITIQKRMRAYYLMKAQREIYLRIIRSTISIQRMYRSYVLTKITRTEYLNTKMTVQFIQRKYRAKLAMVKCLQEYRKQKSSAEIIQRFYRSYMTMKTQQHYYSQLRQHVITIQSIFKMKLCRKNYLIKRTAAIKIQAFYRMFAVRREFSRLKSCTILIQTRFRSYILAREIRRQYLKTRIGIIRIQSIIRQRIAQKRYLAIRHSVLLIQTQFRTKVRLEAERRELMIKNEGARIIQSYWRGYIERCRYSKMKEAVISCQRRRRATVAMRQELECYRRVRCSVVRLQAAARGWLVRKSVSRLVEQHEERKQQLNNCKAATVIQKNWRGHRVRRQAAEHCAVAALRRRWREGALQSDQQTLAQRSEDAMDVLCHFQDVASVIRAFKTLDYVTNVYPMMYGSRETALPLITRLVAYMGSTNRSVSTLETLQLGVAVLLNLTKFTPTAHYVYKVEHLNTMLTLMLRWCDKDSQLCRLFCTLLWMFGKYEDIRKEMCTILRNGEPYKILSKIRCSLERKRRMDSHKRTSHVGTAPLNSSALSRSFLDSSFLSRAPPCSTPLRPRAPRHHPPLSLSPSTEPDYGISRSHHPRIFQDDIQAMDAVFFKFNLPLTFIGEN